MVQQFNIDPAFSVYRLTKRSLRDTSVMNHRRTMSMISHEIENASIIDGADNIIFASFQRMSKFLPQLERYRQLAAEAQHIYVFGIMDCVLPGIGNITYVPVQPQDQLAKEWFIVSSGSQYFSALATEEITHIDDPDHKRKFHGVWSFDAFLVGILHEWLSGIVGLRPDVQTEHKKDYLRQAELMNNTIERISARAASTKDQLIRSELERIMHGNLQTTYQSIKDTQTTGTV